MNFRINVPVTLHTKELYDEPAPPKKCLCKGSPPKRMITLYFTKRTSSFYLSVSIEIITVLAALMLLVIISGLL